MFLRAKEMLCFLMAVTHGLRTAGLEEARRCEPILHWRVLLSWYAFLDRG